MSAYTKKCGEKAPETLTAENLENLETCRMEYEKKYDYFVRGSIIPFLATWYEQGERNKFFFNLENSNKKKSCIRKFLKSDGEETTDANVILNEIYIFYSDLYDKKPKIQTDFTGRPFEVNSSTVPKLNDAM